MLTQELLKQYLSYNPENGLFIWLQYKQRPSKIGSIAGCLRKDKYWTICLMEKQYFAHRLAWLYVYGKFPKNDIDHINGNKIDNRIVNLRECNQAQNNQNFKNPRINNATKLLGVSFRNGKFRARIGINKKIISIGTFNTAHEAHNAYLQEKRKIHEFCTI